VDFLLTLVTFQQPGILWPEVAGLRPWLLVAACALLAGIARRANVPRAPAFGRAPFIALVLFVLAQTLSVIFSGVSSMIEEFAFWAQYLMFVVISVLLITSERALRRYVWGAMIGEICMGGSELPFHNHWGSGAHPVTLTRPSHATLERGHLLVNEIEAAYAGYHAQQVQPFAVQDCDPVEKDVDAIHAEWWQRRFEAQR